jgi:transcriptional regulator with XRE-family HTH domain
MVIGLVERIIQLRKQRGMSQTELAKALGLSRSSVNAWERETAQPSPDALVALSRLFGVSTDYLLGIDKHATINVSGLTDSEIHSLMMVAGEFRKK